MDRRGRYATHRADRAHGIMFHHFHGGRHRPSPGSITDHELDAVIDHLGPGRILPATDWIERTLTGRLGPNDLCLTFDDAPRSQFDIALAVLRRRGMTAFFFIPTGHLAGHLPRLELYRWFRATRFRDADDFEVAFESELMQGPLASDVKAALRSFDPASYLAEFPFYTEADRRYRFLRDDVLGPAEHTRTLDAMMRKAGIDATHVAQDLVLGEAEIRSLADMGHAIGLHSHTHPTRFADLPLSEQERELRQNRSVIETVIGRAPVSMSHPNGSYGPETLAILQDLGVQVGFRSSMRAISPRVPALEQPREDHANVIAALRSVGAWPR